MPKEKLESLSTEELLAKYESLKTNYNRLDSLQNNAKLRANSLYGALGSAQFRWYDPRIAESVTISGQVIIKQSEQAINAFLQKLMGDKKDRVVYMHTDSAQVCMEDVVEKFFADKTEEERVRLLVKIATEKIEPLLDKTYVSLAERFRCKKNRISMKTEAVCTRTFYIAKAKYAQYVYYNEGTYYTEPKLKIVGLDAIRSNIPEISRRLMKEAYKEIFEHGQEALQRFIKEKREWFKSLPVEEIAFPRGVNGIEKYSANNPNGYIKGTPAHVKAAILYNRMLSDLNLGVTYDKIFSGDKMKFIYLKEPNTVGEDKIGFMTVLPPEFKLHKFVDSDTQFQKAFLGPMENVLSIIGWESEERNTMDSFFTME
jgi:DNA polymerase elongation subunit (family B)